MTIDRERLRWNGWGRLGESFEPTRARAEALLEELGRRLGRPPVPGDPPVAIDAVRLPPAKLSAEVLAALRAACGDEGVRTSVHERAMHAAGKSLPDLLRLRRGEIGRAPEAVAYPADEGAVVAVLRVASGAGLAVVPFGGGTSVVGGVDARTASGQVGALALDTSRLDRLLRVDPKSRTATFEAGIDGPALEAALQERGFTLGHYPQSFEHSTLGGWIATRSCGQQSDGYGGIDRMLVAVRVVTPQGVLRSVEVPRSAAGPDLNELVLGSEGALGVITEATLRVRKLPAVQDARGVLFRRFSDGVAAVHALVGDGVSVSMLRLSDAEETRLGIALRRDPARRFDPASTLLRGVERLGYRDERCLLVFAVEGSDVRGARALRKQVQAVARRHGGLSLGRGPGRSWRRDRFRTPYVRDWLLDHGVAADTFETAVPWSRVEEAHDSILRALRATLQTHAGGGVAMAHLSHSYPDGACLYFTALYPIDGARAVEQWVEIKRDATEAILAAGGTLSHHHGVGHDHAPWLSREKGALGLEALRAAKKAVDPGDTMNPGKML